MNFEYDMILDARNRIKDYIIKTPLVKSWALSEMLGCEIYLKLDNLQVTGSFKYRGAINSILSLSEEELKKGVVAASSGNHGKALSYGCKLMGSKATIVIPDSAPQIKKDAIKNLGANIIECKTEERFDVAREFAETTDANLIPPYDFQPVLAGQGTIGMEIMEQKPDLDYVLIPVSGGGLLGGAAKAIKAVNEKTEVIGVEPEIIPKYSKSLEKGEPVTVEPNKSFADALASNRPGLTTFPIVKENVKRTLTVSEEKIKEAVKVLFLEGKILAEGAGAIGLAAILDGKIKFNKDDKVCLVISGGSISMEQIESI